MVSHLVAIDKANMLSPNALLLVAIANLLCYHRCQCRSMYSFKTATRNLLTQTLQLSAQGYQPVSEFFTSTWANVRLSPSLPALLNPRADRKADRAWENRSIKVYTATTKTSSPPTGSRSSRTWRPTPTTTSCITYRWRASRKS